MTEPAAATGDSGTAAEPGIDAPPAPDTEPDTAQLADRITERLDDLTRVIARQAATIDRLADDAKARAQRERAGADVPLVVELFSLYGEARAFASTAQSEAEQTAFDTFANRVERLLTGRGGQVVEPKPDTVFDALTMEAADTITADAPDLDRTVDSIVTPGLLIADRSVRPARVVVRRYKAAPAEAAPVQEDDAATRQHPPQ
ncbi:nucleotide exchange factor GrpE [Nocardia sp. NPDC051030]|uniref:nucleotide exchange factor GrpE n=1 Tax=Nocardia sp. NPDC051030 TaxID=3155162 RepID=UPI003430F6FA